MPGVRALARGLCASIASAALLAGCSAHTSGSEARPVATRAAAPSMSAGMTMPDGAVMGTKTAIRHAVDAGVPSTPAAMICSDEVRHDLAEALAVRSIAAGRRSYRDSLLTCDYSLFGGHLVLGVKDLPSASATRAYLASSRRSLAHTHSVDGLTQGAFGNGTGVVMLSKDDHVLRVDTSAMPPVFGSQHNNRADFAYEVATVILGCWTGN